MNNINNLSTNEELIDSAIENDDFAADDTSASNSIPEENTEQLPSAEELTQTIASLQAELDAYKSAAAQQEAISKQINDRPPQKILRWTGSKIPCKNTKKQ